MEDKMINLVTTERILSALRRVTDEDLSELFKFMAIPEDKWKELMEKIRACPHCGREA